MADKHLMGGNHPAAGNHPVETALQVMMAAHPRSRRRICPARTSYFRHHP